MRPTLLVSCAAAALLIGVAGASAQSPEHKAAPGLSKKSPAAAGHQAKPSASPEHGMAEHRSAAETPKAAKETPKTDAMSPSNEPKSHQGATNDKSAPTPQGANDKASQQPKSAESNNQKPDTHRSAAEAGKQSGSSASKTDRSAATAKSDPNKSDLSKTEPSKTDASKTDASKTGANTSNPTNTQTGRSATSTSGTADRANTQPGMAGHETNSSSTSVQIDAQKQERIRTALSSTKVENIRHADFSVSVGTRVPERYHFHPLPTEIVNIVPEYRGFDYMVVDNEIVIVNPHTREIVYTMSEGRSAGMNRPSVDCR